MKPNIKNVAKSAGKGTLNAAKTGAKVGAKQSIKYTDNALRRNSEEYDTVRTTVDKVDNGVKNLKRIKNGTQKTIKTIKNLPSNIKKTIKGIKTVGQAGQAAVSGIAWLFSNPVGWAILAVIAFMFVLPALGGGSKDTTTNTDTNAASSLYQSGDGDINVDTSNLTDEQKALINACNTDSSDSKSNSSSKSGSSASTLTSEEQLENAKKIYSVLSEWGLSDEQIAGALGNGEVESSLNPKKIESDYTAAFKSDGFEVADKNHDASVETLFNGGWSAFVAAYGSVSLDEATYKGLGASDTDDGKHWPGIGIWQWTGVGARGLSKFAKANNLSIWSIDTQLTYLLSSVDDDASYYSRLENYKKQSYSTAAEAGAGFAKLWEGNTSMAQGERQQNATKWLVQIKKFDKDTSYANSILSAAKASKTSSNSSSAAKQEEASVCGDTESNSKSSIDSGYLMKVKYSIAYGYGAYYPGGPEHRGVDIHSSEGEGTDLYAAASGTVIVADGTSDPAGAWMTVIKLDDGSGYNMYGHLVSGSNSSLKVGDKIEKGDYIGKLGNTGNSTGAHLHFEYSKTWYEASLSNSPNPWQFLKGVESADQIDGTKHALSDSPIIIDPTKD